MSEGRLQHRNQDLFQLRMPSNGTRSMLETKTGLSGIGYLHCLMVSSLELLPTLAFCSYNFLSQLEVLLVHFPLFSGKILCLLVILCHRSLLAVVLSSGSCLL